MKPIKGFVRPERGEEVTTLCFHFLRAELMLGLELQLKRELVSSGQEEALLTEVRTGYPAKQWTYLTGHLAALSAVVEGWLKEGLRDEAVDQLLHEGDGPRLREQLKEVRHSVYHPNAVDNPALPAMTGDRLVVRWSLRLHRAFRAYFRSQAGEDYPTPAALGFPE